MFRTEVPLKKLALATGVMLMAAAEAIAQEKTGKPARRIVVSLPDRKLAVLEDDRVLKVYDTAVGAPVTPSPTGDFTIVTRVSHPTWYTKGRTVPPGAANPLGTRWLGLSAKGYGIHGTNRPSSIGHDASHGCIRMRNRDVEELFEMVSVGDAVEMYGERSPETERLFGSSTVVAMRAASEPAAQTAAGMH
ncbi:MAG TPA: L,D-transpeptidase [Bryobacteraceae bacterium]|nr:L,D-transpeptidase [Bryobacteraceae bacterium]